MKNPSIYRIILTGFLLTALFSIIGSAFINYFIENELLEITLSSLIIFGAAAYSGFIISTKIKRHIDSISNSIITASNGEINRSMNIQEDEMPQEFHTMAGAFIQLVELMKDFIIHIENTALEVASSSDKVSITNKEVGTSTAEVASSMQQISKGAELQSDLVDQTSRLIGEIAHGIENTSRTAEDAAQSVSETSEAAQSGVQVTKMAVDKMNQVFQKIENFSDRVYKLNEKNKEISKIAGMITLVAQKTNLLALNATIEAARAGEYGRGFAVVADEVRKLAELTGKSAEQITELVSAITAESEKSVESMLESTRELNEGREDMSTIITSLEDINRLAMQGVEKVIQISTIAKDHLRGADEMVNAIDNISRVADNNAAATEEVSSATQQQSTAIEQLGVYAAGLVKLSRELDIAVSRFKR